MCYVTVFILFLFPTKSLDTKIDTNRIGDSMFLLGMQYREFYVSEAPPR